MTIDLSKAECLNDCFIEPTKLLSTPNPIPNLLSATDDQHVADSLSTTPREVYKIVTQLSLGKAPGLDGIPPSFSTSLCLWDS